MNFLYQANEIPIGVDYNESALMGLTASNQYVTNIVPIDQSFTTSILIPSGTGGLTVWVNNRKYYNRFTPEPYNITINPTVVGMPRSPVQYMYDDSDVNDGFSSSWVNITNDKVVTIGASAFYLASSFRWMRLQLATSLSASTITGSTTAVPFASVWLGSTMRGV